MNVFYEDDSPCISNQQLHHCYDNISPDFIIPLFKETDPTDLPDIIPTTKANQKRSKLIHKTFIHKPNFKKILKKNGNVPKFNISNFHRHLDGLASIYHGNNICLNSTRHQINKWIQEKTELKTNHLHEIFGGHEDEDVNFRNFLNRKAMQRLIRDDEVDLVMLESKVENPISYLVCLEKYAYRLPNQDLVGRVQSR